MSAEYPRGQNRVHRGLGLRREKEATAMPKRRTISSTLCGTSAKWLSFQQASKAQQKPVLSWMEVRVEVDFFSLHPGTKSHGDKDQLPGRTALLRAGGYRRPFLGSLKSLLNHCWKITMSVLDMYRGSVCPRSASSPRQPLVSAT